jgi:hypothetical protein
LAGLAQRPIAASGVALVLAIRRDPQAVFDEPGAATRIVVGSQQRVEGHRRPQLIADRKAHRVAARRIDDAPQPSVAVVADAPPS